MMLQPAQLGSTAPEGGEKVLRLWAHEVRPASGPGAPQGSPAACVCTYLCDVRVPCLQLFVVCIHVYTTALNNLRLQVLRVFYDRLVDDKDRSWFLAYLKTVMKEQLTADFDKLFSHLHAHDGGKVRACQWAASRQLSARTRSKGTAANGERCPMRPRTPGGRRGGHRGPASLLLRCRHGRQRCASDLWLPLLIHSRLEVHRLMLDHSPGGGTVPVPRTGPIIKFCCCSQPDTQPDTPTPAEDPAARLYDEITDVPALLARVEELLQAR